MSSYHDLMLAAEERKRREKEAPSPTEPVPSEPVPVQPPQVQPVTPKPVAAEPVSPEPVPPKAAPTKTRKPVVPEPVALRDRPADEGRFTLWPHEFWDELAPTMDGTDQVVLAHFYRLSSGKNAGYCKISLPRLAERCNCGLTRLRASLRRLEGRGLVERLDVDGSSSDWQKRGVEWRVNVGRLEPAKGESGQNRSRHETPSPAPPMKEEQREKQEQLSDPVRIREARRRELLKARPDATAREIEDALDRWDQ